MAKAGHSSFLLEGPAPSGPVRRRSPCLPWRIKKEFHHPFTRIRGHTGVHGEEGAEYWSMGVLEDLFAGGEWVSGYRERVKRKSEFQSNSKFPISWFQVSPFIPASGPAEAGTTNIRKHLNNFNDFNELNVSTLSFTLQRVFIRKGSLYRRGTPTNRRTGPCLLNVRVSH